MGPENFACPICTVARLAARPGDPRIAALAEASGWLRTPTGYVCSHDCARSAATPFSVNASGSPHRVPTAPSAPEPVPDARVTCATCGNYVFVAPGAHVAAVLSAHGFITVAGTAFCSERCRLDARRDPLPPLTPVTRIDDQVYARRRAEALARAGVIPTSHVRPTNEPVTAASTRRAPPPKGAA